MNTLPAAPPPRLTDGMMQWLEIFAEAEESGLTNAAIAERECVALVSVRNAGQRLRRSLAVFPPAGGFKPSPGRYTARAALVREARDLCILPAAPTKGGTR